MTPKRRVLNLSVIFASLCYSKSLLAKNLKHIPLKQAPKVSSAPVYEMESVNWEVNFQSDTKDCPWGLL